MKIAFVTEDGTSISKHFGRAPFYQVVEIVDGAVKSSEILPKIGCAHSHSHEEGDTDQNEAQKHQKMSDPIRDCKLVVSGGMGFGAYQSLMLRGIRTIMTEIDLIDDAVTQYIEGKLEDRPELLH